MEAEFPPHYIYHNSKLKKKKLFFLGNLVSINYQKPESDNKQQPKGLATGKKSSCYESLEDSSHPDNFISTKKKWLLLDSFVECKDSV